MAEDIQLDRLDEPDRGDDLRNSRRLDVHRWSDHPEVNNFVDQVYAEHFQGGNEKIRKRHVKVLLLDMYVAWCDDPDLKIAYPRNPGGYKAKSVYNELHISRLTIDVADRLVEVGLAKQAKGFFNRDTGGGFMSRIWPADALVAMFKEAKFSVFDVSYREDRLPICLRDKDKNDVEFDAADPEIVRQINQLNAYNALLHRSFIAIPDIESAAVEPDEFRAGKILFASQSNKYVRRIYNNGSFELGGRFHGPWWTFCPKHLREKILINDHLTIEIDYSSLHPTILYAEVGIDYWKEVGQDPYQLPGLALHEEPAELRNLAKQLFLILINAENIDKVPPALRDGAPKGHWAKRLTDEEVLKAVDAIKKLHEPIAGAFHSGVGLRLQNVDSQISATLLNHFLELGAPILMIHDSYIVRQGFEDLLEVAMEMAFKQTVGKDFAAKSKYAGRLAEDVERELLENYNLRYGKRGTNEEEERDMALYRKMRPIRSKYYKRQLSLFNDWRNLQDQTYPKDEMIQEEPMQESR